MRLAPGITPIAWLIAPSALLFALFFFLPMGLMAMISLLTGNPVVQPNVDFTTKYYRRIFDDTYYFEVIWTTIRIGLLDHAFGVADRLPAGALDGAYPWSHSLCHADDGRIDADADGHCRPHLCLDGAVVGQGRRSTRP